jgi:hypothetical protein
MGEQDVVRLRHDAFRLEVLDDGQHVEVATDAEREELARAAVARFEHDLGFGQAFAVELVDEITTALPPNDDLAGDVGERLDASGERHLARPAAVRRVQLD